MAMYPVTLPHFIKTAPFAIARRVYHFLSYVAAEALAYYHLYFPESLKAREITLINEAISALEKGLDASDSLTELLGTFQPQRSDQSDVLIALKIHRYCVFRLFHGVQANQALMEVIHHHLHPPVVTIKVALPAPIMIVTVPDPFSKLQISDDYKNWVGQLVAILADTSTLRLPFKEGEMRKLGEKINPHHPLMFLGHVISTPHLRKKMKKIRQETLRWEGIKLKPGFSPEFVQRLENEHQKNDLSPFLPGFCRHIGIPEDKLKPYVGQWKQFLEVVVTHDYDSSSAQPLNGGYSTTR